MISTKLLPWFKKNGRALPWRASKTPYKVWLSEILLQQTRVAQGLGYYHKFISEYPDIFALAEASEEDILKLWQGLGYYSRARNLHYTARYVVDELDGEFPTSSKELQKLKGIGPYTAAAIASICYDEQRAVVDGNVYRVLSRYFALKKSPDDKSAYKFYEAIALKQIPASKPGEFNEAMMELGALICKPTNPQCTTCPLSADCLAYKQGSQSKFPIRLKKNKKTKIQINYLIVQNARGLMMRKRKNGIWKNMYDFPELHFDEKSFQKKEAVDMPAWLKNATLSRYRKKYKHILTHLEIEANCYKLTESEAYISAPNEELVDLERVATLPIPRLVERILKDLEIL